MSFYFLTSFLHVDRLSMCWQGFYFSMGSFLLFNHSSTFDGFPTFATISTFWSIFSAFDGCSKLRCSTFDRFLYFLARFPLWQVLLLHDQFSTFDRTSSLDRHSNFWPIYSLTVTFLQHASFLFFQPSSPFSERIFTFCPPFYLRCTIHFRLHLLSRHCSPFHDELSTDLIWLYTSTHWRQTND